MGANVSSEDRRKADAIVSRWPFKGNAYFDRSVADIAQALADERAAARQSFLPNNPDVGKVAFRVEAWPHDPGANGEEYVAGHMSAADAASWLREIADRCERYWGDPECPWPDEHGVPRKPVDEAQMRAEAAKREAYEQQLREAEATP